MDKKEKEDFFSLFSKAFHEVVAPILEDLRSRIKKIEENMATKEDTDRIERRLVKIDDRLDRHGKVVDNHEKRIVHLETKSHPLT